MISPSDTREGRGRVREFWTPKATVAFPGPETGNSLYPLPPDYYELTEDGQRLARLNAVCRQETPEELVHAWRFFREWYLSPADARWYKRKLASPPMHFQMVHDVGKYSRNAWAAPRAFAKSTVVKEIGMLLTLTRPQFVLSLVQATIKKYRMGISSIKYQMENNQYLNDDFGQIWCKRGERLWGNEQLQFAHGGLIQGGSIEGHLRGDRPDLLLVDDPEYDEDDSVDTEALREKFQVLLFRVLMPMLEDGSGLFWVGTEVSRKAYLYVVTRGTDPRFKFWNKRVLSIDDVNPDGSLLWEAKWNEQKMEDLRESLGEEAFQSEYRNNPGAGSAKTLKLHPEYGTYTVEGSPEKSANPLQSSATITYTMPTRVDGRVIPSIHRQNYGDWVNSLYRIITVDSIRKPSPTSDYACVMGMGFDLDDTLWVLDCWLDRRREDEVIRKAWDMAMRWQVRAIGFEAVATQQSFVDRASAMISEMSAGSGYVPRVVPIKYARRSLKNTDAPTAVSKGERIASMEWRFNQYRMRLPVHRQGEFAFAQLFYQIENFTINLDLLHHDDAVDTLAMHQYMVRRRGNVHKRTPLIKTAVEQLAAGNLVDEGTGIPYISGINASEMTPDILAACRKARGEVLPDREPEIDMGVWGSCPNIMRVLHL